MATEQKIKLYPGRLYYIADGFSCEKVFFVGTDKSGKVARFMEDPYTQTRTMPVETFLYGVVEGCTKTLKDLLAMEDGEKKRQNSIPTWLSEEIKNLNLIVGGWATEEIQVADIRGWVVHFSYTGEGDGWEEIEKAIPHSIERRSRLRDEYIAKLNWKTIRQLNLPPEIVMISMKVEATK